MTILETAIIIVVAIVVLAAFDILVNKLRRRKRSREWERKGRG